MPSDRLRRRQQKGRAVFRRLVCLVIHCANMAPATFERDRPRAAPRMDCSCPSGRVLLSPNFLAFGLRLCRKRRRAKLSIALSVEEGDGR